MQNFWDMPRSPINRQSARGMAHEHTLRDIRISRFLTESDQLLVMLNKIKKKGTCTLDEEMRIINRIIKLSQMADKLKDMDLKS